MSSSIDLYLLYRIISDITKPFDKTKAFELGLIDASGKKLKSASTPEEKKALSYYTRFVFNIKRLLAKFGLSSRTATFAAALFLLREQVEPKYVLIDEGFNDENGVLTDLVSNIKYLEKNSQKNFRQLEEELANVTGPAVAGTGDDPVHWKKLPYKVGPYGDRKRKGRYINAVEYLKKMTKEAAKKQNT